MSTEQPEPVCNCGTCQAIEADRVLRATAAEESK